MGEIVQLFPKRKPTIEQLELEAIEYIGAGWERAARNNRLNDFFIEQTKPWSKTDTSYVLDLNPLSMMESKLGMIITIRSPVGVILGWQASFMVGDHFLSTPILSFETYARSFNILVFMKLRRDFVSHGYTF